MNERAGPSCQSQGIDDSQAHEVAKFGRSTSGDGQATGMARLMTILLEKDFCVR